MSPESNQSRGNQRYKQEMLSHSIDQYLGQKLNQSIDLT